MGLRLGYAYLSRPWVSGAAPASPAKDSGSTARHTVHNSVHRAWRNEGISWYVHGIYWRMSVG